MPSEAAHMADEWITDAVGRRTSRMVDVRRHLHQHPELSGSERATAAFVADRLRELGMAPELVLDGTGVMAELHGTAAQSGAPRCLLLRADIDALPITEADDGRPYRSHSDGVMHACGHDAHAAIALGVADVLSEHRDALAGSVLFVFQPDEERIRGARALIEAGIFEGRGVDGVLGLHVLSQLEVGTVGVRPGVTFASCDQFTIEVVGVAGHGGLPHRALDPIPTAAALVLQTQTLISRECSPLDSAAVSFGAIHGGTGPTSIPGSVVLEGTVRAFDAALRERLLSRVEEMAVAIASAGGLEVRFVRGPGVPPVVSDPAMTEIVGRAAASTPGVVVDDIGPLPVADDMAELLALAPGCYFMLGGGSKARGMVAPHHHPDFDLDEACLPLGAEVLARAALDFCARDVAIGADLERLVAPVQRRIDGSGYR